MEIKINQDIKNFNETMFFGLSTRQFIFSLLACAAAGGVTYHGMTAVELAKAWIKSESRRTGNHSDYG